MGFDGRDHGDDTESTPCPISKRAFLSTVAMGGLTATASQAAGNEQTSPDRDALRWYMTDELEWIYERVGQDTRIPVLAEVLRPESLRRFETVGTATRRSKAPTPAVYAQLTPEELAEVSRRQAVQRLRFAPGANPFWKVDTYRNGVFPGPTEAVDYVAYEEALAGLEYLEREHSDRLAIKTAGQTVGLDDEFVGRRESYGVPLIELTENVTEDGAVAEKETIVCSLSIHGDERSGVEGGLRFVERVLSGDEPEVEAALDEIAFVFVLGNPDGWMGRDPTTVNVEAPDSDAFMRHTGADVDPNRQYPTGGLIDPSHNPADPNGLNLIDDIEGIDEDVEESYLETVPDSLGIVDTLREYGDIAFGIDYHGMYGSKTLLEALYENNEYGVRQQGRLDVFNDQLNARLEGRVAELLAENDDAITAAAEARGGGRSGKPETVFDHGTIFDTIGYTVPGGMGSWLGDALEQGGLDAPSLTFEMALDNSPPGVSLTYRPKLLEVHAETIWETMREVAAQVQREIDTDIQAGGTDVGYVTTDQLTRDSDDLSFDSAPTVQEWTREVKLEETADGRIRVPVKEDVHTLSVTVSHRGGSVETARLDDPTGSVRRQGTIENGEFGRGTDWLLTGAEGGVWELTVDGDRDGVVSVHVTTVAAEDVPDPREVLGYEQREYEVSPLAYFEAYDEALVDGSMSDLSIEGVTGGALLEDGEPAVDKLVVIHDDGADTAGYVDALETYVDAGGELVLTDSGVSLLSALSVAGADQIDADAIESTVFPLAITQGKREHPLLDGIREIQRELWTAITLGYSLDNEAPMTLIDPETFESAGGAIAATTQEQVIAGQLGSITVLGSLFPPGYQQNLHPFGLSDFALSSMGQQLFRNALDHEQ